MARGRFGFRDMTNELNARHKKFIAEYLDCLNATDAYMQTYPKASYETARRSASALMTNPDIAGEISRRIEERTKLDKSEILIRLGNIARANLDDFLDDHNRIDMDRARSRNVMPVVKKYTIKERFTSGDDDNIVMEQTATIELHDPLSAMDKLLRAHGMYRDNVKIDLPNVDVTKLTDEELEEIVARGK